MAHHSDISPDCIQSKVEGRTPRVLIFNGQSTRGLLVLLLCLLVAVQEFPAQGEPEPLVASEHVLKAAWLLNFVRFTDFPTNAFPSKESPIVIGVVGKDPYGAELERAFGGKTIKGRLVRVRKVSSEREIQGCQVIFIAASERRRLREIFQSMKGLPILTVGEADGFLDQGGGD